MLTLAHVPVATWPRLAWVASFRSGHPVVTVYAGSSVETSLTAAVEGVWPGTFENRDFDVTDLFFGSGVRVRDGRARFVSSCSTVDRLWRTEHNGHGFVSNSLPGLLTVSGNRLDPDYRAYRQDFQSIVKGLDKYTKSIPAEVGQVKVSYWEDLEFDGHEMATVPKVFPVRNWPDFSALRSFYFDTARRIGENARLRPSPITPVATISSGYDSPVAALMAREAGATRALTIDSARSLLPRSDSGAEIAEHLGLDCSVVRARTEQYRHEEFFVAALGWSMDLNMSLLKPDHPLTLLFTGFHGDKVWDRTRGVLSDLIVRGDPSGLGLSEYRLCAGIINCPVPYWGVREAERVREIAISAEMKPWTLNSDYDRPIPRRLVEEAGVPRRLFGQRKSATTIDGAVYLPITADGASSFKAYLRQRDMRWLSPTLVKCLNLFDASVAGRLRERLGLQWPKFSVDVPAASFLVDWAVGTLIEEQYSHSLFPQES